MNKVCLQCKKAFEKRWNYSLNYWKTQKYCSLKCMGDAYRGVKLSPERYKKLLETHNKRGPEHWNWKGGPKVTKHAWRKANPDKEKLYRQHKSEETKSKDKERSRKYTTALFELQC